MKGSLVSVGIGVAVMAFAPGAGSAVVHDGASAHAAFSGHCKAVALSPVIEAKVVVHRDTCARGRALVRHWQTVQKAENKAARRLEVDGYVCVWKPRTKTALVLRCTSHVRVVRAEWHG